MGAVTTIGVDIAKSVFQVHGIDAAGEVVFRRRLTRARVVPFFAKLAGCQIASNCDPSFAFNNDPSGVMGLGLST